MHRTHATAWILQCRKSESYRVKAVQLLDCNKNGLTISVLAPLHCNNMERSEKKPKRSTLRLHQHWQRIMYNRRPYYSIALTNWPSHDMRPYADVIVLGERASGLIDIGATISCFISDCAGKIINKGWYTWG